MTNSTIDPTAEAAASTRNSSAIGFGSVAMRMTTKPIVAASRTAAATSDIQADPRSVTGPGAPGAATGPVGETAGVAPGAIGVESVAARRSRMTMTWRITIRQNPTNATTRLTRNPMANATLTLLS